MHRARTMLSHPNLSRSEYENFASDLRGGGKRLFFEVPQSLELFADRAFVQLYAEYLLNAPLQIGAPPPHYAVFVIIRTFLDKSASSAFCAAVSRQGRPGALRFLSPAKPSAL